MSQQYTENKMGVMPVNKLLITMSVPMMISMLVQALYNIIDSIFVARISEDALTAVSLAFPAQNLMIAVAVGTGVGINALLSRSLGAKDYSSVNSTATNGLFLSVCSYVVFAFLGLLFCRQFFVMQTDIASIIEYGTLYLRICLIGSFGIFLEVTFEKLLQSTGKTFYTMITQTTGAVINIVFDPLLIFGIGFFPELGIAGAAIATIFGQYVAAAMALWFNLKRNPEIRLKFKGFRPSGRIIKRIYSIGVPSIVMASVGSIMVFGLNKILTAFTSTAAAVFGVYFKLQSFIFMPVFGLNNGMVPIVSYNFGAGNPKRISQTIRLSVIYAVSIMLIGFAVFWIFTAPLLSMFDASPTMLAIGVPALRTISLSFIFAGFCIITLSVCQALGHGMLSLIVSVVRQLVVLLPVAYLLSLTGKLDAVWWAFPIAELFSVLLSAIFLRRLYRTEIKPLALRVAQEKEQEQAAPANA